MRGRAVVFEEIGKVALREFDVPEPRPEEVLAQTLVSGISVGTERWAYSGKRPEIKFPNVPGYMGIASVMRVGAEAQSRGYVEGQLINFSRSRLPEPYASHSWMASHLSHAVVNVAVPAWDPEGFNGMQVERLPDGLDVMQASLTQLAAVALRGIEMAAVPMGARVLVCGLGVIGLYAVQICRLKGAQVAATDVVDARLELAKQYGAQWVIDGKSDDLKVRSEEAAPGGFDIIIDTSSIPAVVNRLFPLLKLWGKFVFQGWYAPPSPFDFNALHGRLPTCYVPCGHTGRATAAAMRWAAEGRLDTRAMITHVVRPDEASAIYEMLAGGAEGSRDRLRLEEIMKALVVNEDHHLELRDIAPPVPGRFEALVKIEACGICSTTDSEIIRGTQPYHNLYPCLLGHEAIGRVASVGAGVKHFQVGDRVTRPAAIWPGASRDDLASGWGGFAELGIVRDREAMAEAGDPSALSDYTALRQRVLPEGFSIAEAVALIALAETLSWSRSLPAMEGKQVCVAGTGIAGLSIAFWAKYLGAKNVVVLGRRDQRLALARTLGADHGVNVREGPPAARVRELTGGGADLFLEASGQKDQLNVGCSLLRPGGTVAVYGVPPDGRYELDWKLLPPDVRFLQPPAEEHLAYADVAQFIQHKKVPIEKLMTHQWPLAEFARAFEAVRQGEVVKSMLLMPMQQV